MRGLRTNHWSLDRASDLAFLALGTAVGVGNFLVLPSLVLYRGGLSVVLVHFLSLIVLGSPLALAELIWGRWLLRPYTQSFKAVRPGFGWVPLLAMLALVTVAPPYFVEMGRTAMLLSKSISVRGFSGVAVVTGVRGAVFGTGAFAIGLLWLCSLLTAGSVVRLARSLKTFVLVALALWFVLALHVGLEWGSAGLRATLGSEIQPLSWDEIFDIAAFSLFSLSAGFGILYTFVFYASQAPLKASTGRTFWERPGSLLRVIVIMLIGDMFASAVSLVLISPYGLVGREGLGPLHDSRMLMLDWVPQILARGPQGFAWLLVHFGALLSAAMAAALSLVDTCVFHMERDLGWSRRKAAFHVASLGSGLILFSLVPAIGDAFAFFGGSLMLAISALALALGVGWLMPERAQRQIFGRGLQLDRLFTLWRLTLRWLVPAVLIVAIARMF